MNQPKVIECFTDNGEHSHWKLIDPDTGATLWEQKDPQDEIIEIEGKRFRRGDIYDIYEVERDKQMFLNRDAGFIVKTYGSDNTDCKLSYFYERIAYESTPGEIGDKKSKWDRKMKEAIKIWKGETK